jgi:hypothetical protein
MGAGGFWRRIKTAIGHGVSRELKDERIAGKKKPGVPRL